MSLITPNTFRSYSSLTGTSTRDAAPPPAEENIFAPDYYEILRVDQRADRESLERIYRTLAERFRPDTAGTGDAKAFQRVRKAYDTLSDETERARYNAARQHTARPKFFDSVRGGQNYRLAVLCILYRRKIGAPESPGLSVPDLEQMTGSTSEELTSALWYLCEKNWAALGDRSDYSITADGFDTVESEAEGHAEFRTLATLPWYDSPGERRDPANSGLAAIILGNTVVADHYEILRIDSKADGETIERVYHASANRFSPDNPLTGDAKAFLRIREAWEILSDPVKRAEFNALRQSPEYSERFRLRRREFFDGLEGEQLRRLAVLYHLYRQAESKLPGLFGRDLEQLTGCTREELGSVLWYLREKKWARLGGFSEYTITAAGFDVVENDVGPGTPASPLANISAAPQAVAEAAQTDIEDEEQEPASIGVASDFAEQFARLRRQIEGEPDSPPPAEEVKPAVTEVSHTSDRPMNNLVTPLAAPSGGVTVSAGKRVILSMGGKGGVGKTSVMTGLAEWFDENQIEVTLLDLDIENKMKGSLTHYFGARVPKINIHTPAGLDAFVDHLGAGAPVVLADMGAGAGHVTHDWFEKMYPDVSATGVAFTAIGVVTSDPASVESVLNWAAALQDSVSYVVVENSLSEHSNFAYWEENVQAQEFRVVYKPAIIRQDYRLADLENAARKYGVTLGQIAGRTTSAAELQKASLVMRAQSYRRRMFAQFDKVKELLLP